MNPRIRTWAFEHVEYFGLRGQKEIGGTGLSIERSVDTFPTSSMIVDRWAKWREELN